MTLVSHMFPHQLKRWEIPQNERDNLSILPERYHEEKDLSFRFRKT